jgi:2-aminoethylphosphonate-pyruvate transaminase
MLIVANGAYGERMITISEYARIPHVVIRYGDDEIANPEDIRRMLKDNPQISHVACVHSETTAGLLNPVEDIGRAVHETNPSIIYIVDAMSSFGAIHLDFYESHIDYLISSSNKMFQGTPGFAYVIAKLSKLRNTKGNARALTLDLFKQWDY